MVNQLPKFLMRNFQVKIMRDFLPAGSRTLVSVARGGGKDYIALACADALCNLKPGSNISYLGVSLKSVKKILFSNTNNGRPMWEEVIDKSNLLPTMNGDYFFKELGCFKYKNGSLIYIIGADQDAELGTSMDALICTECARFTFDKWKFIRGNVQRANGRIMLISTPFFASEFNDLIDGNHREAGKWNIHRYPANVLLNPDGTRVYSDEYLAKIASEYDEASYMQEWFVSTNAINEESVLGRSLQKCLRTTQDDIRRLMSGNVSSRRIFFSFDIGNSDHTSMFTWYVDDFNPIPIMIHLNSKNQTELNYFIQIALKQAQEYNIPPQNCVVILPFDASANIQGFMGKLNRKKEIRQALPKEWHIASIGQMNVIRMIQVCRRCLETNKVAIINNAEGEFMIKCLASINYRREAKTGRLLMEVDKKSGVHFDHDLDSFKYFIAFYYRSMYDEEDDIKIRNEAFENLELGKYNKNNYNILNSNVGKSNSNVFSMFARR